MSIVDLNYLWEEAQHDLRVLIIREELKKLNERLNQGELIHNQVFDKERNLQAMELIVIEELDEKDMKDGSKEE